MGKTILLSLIMALFGLYSLAGADDLYRVTVDSEQDARALRGSGVYAVAPVDGGYLVLADAAARGMLEESGLRYDFLATGVEREELAFDIRMDDLNLERYPVVYAAGGIRLLQVRVAGRFDISDTPGLAPLPKQSARIIYQQPKAPSKSRSPLATDLDSLISLVSLDTLSAYTHTLQAFPNRLTGSLGNIQARDWIYNKLSSFGYDSTFIDTFTASIYGTPTQTYNIVAVKPGTTYPDHHIVIGAHMDAVSGSPGADDNGSGTAGVLEIARVLKDIPTELTIVFALFNAEEQGLHGSYYYADNAAARGDSIVTMLNMDMIGYEGNTVYASLHHGSDLTYVTRWQELADSLTQIGLTGVLAGESQYSDHWPFQRQGYPVAFVIEYNFSSVYHTPNDSTSYIDFSYMTKIVKAMLATASDVSATHTPTPGLVIAPIDQPPSMILPATTTSFQVEMTAGAGGSITSGSEWLHYSINGGAYDSSALVDLGSGVYEAILPAILCGDKINYYVSGEEATTAVTYYYPDPSSPITAIPVTSTTTVFADDFETDQGWVVSGSVADGPWTRGIPVGGGDRGDPPTDYDGSGRCYLTDNVDDNSDVDGGTTILTSPTINCSTGDAQIEYARWFSNDFGSAPYEDVFRVLLSNDNGGTWVQVDSAGPVEDASGGWVVHRLVISDFLTPTGHMKLRFEASDLGSGSVVEAGVDAVTVTVLECQENYFAVTTDSLPDWTADHMFSQQLEAVGGSGTLSWTDKFDDLAGTGLTLSSSGLVSGVPAAAQTVAFTAQVTDEADSSVEKSFSMTINPAVTITTLALPRGTQGEPYSQQLGATGGTGALSWSDLNADLEGTGLTLGSDGSLTGTPISAGVISFTATCTDDVGASDDAALTVTASPAYICGDMNGDENGPNVDDLTYMVNYLFKGGPAPPVTEAADVDSSGALNVSDLTQMVDYLFKGGTITCP